MREHRVACSVLGLLWLQEGLTLFLQPPHNNSIPHVCAKGSVELDTFTILPPRKNYTVYFYDRRFPDPVLPRYYSLLQNVSFQATYACRGEKEQQKSSSSVFHSTIPSAFLIFCQCFLLGLICILDSITVRSFCPLPLLFKKKWMR